VSTNRTLIPLLEADAELGEGLTADELGAARRAVGVQAAAL
jgi:hypothetical protein